MAYQISLTQGLVGFQDVASISTTKQHRLGTEARIEDATNGWAGTAIYVEFKTSTAYAAGLVVEPETLVGGTETPFRMVVSPTTTGFGNPLFVVLTAVSSNAALQYGWVLVVGVAPTLKTAVKPLASSTIGISGTAGRIFISLTSADQILGARFVKSSVTTTTSLVDIFFNRATKAAAVTAA